MVVLSVVLAERYNSPRTAIPGWWYFLVTHEQKVTTASANKAIFLFTEYLYNVFVVIKIRSIGYSTSTVAGSTTAGFLLIRS